MNASDEGLGFPASYVVELPSGRKSTGAMIAGGFTKDVMWYRVSQDVFTAHCIVPKPSPLSEPSVAKWLKEVGKRIRAERMKKGLTQEKLAEMALLAPRNIQKLEGGEFSCLISTLQRVRKALGCRYDDLLPD